MVLIAAMPGLAWAEEPVYFADANLKAAIEERLGVADPTQTDMLGLTDLVAEDRGITDVTGLEYATNLTELRLMGNQISDISALAGLTNLTELYLQSNPLNQAACNIYIPQILANNPGIELSYGECTLALTISSTAGGSVSVPGEGEFLYLPGYVESINAMAVDANFYFVNWSGSAVDAGKVADANSANTTVTMDEDFTVKAHFATILATVYVGESDPNDPNEYGTAEHPLSGIQDAIDVAQGETEIVVSAGVYEGGLVLGDKDIQLIAQEPNDPNEATHPVIVGDVNEPAITFSGAQDANCVLSGFTVTGGTDGIVCDGISPVITNCVVTGSKGYGIACYDSNAVVVNCTVTGNGGGASGGGLSCFDSNVTFINCILWNNFPESITVWSGADPLASFSNIEGTWPGEGNIDADPYFAEPGYWANTNDPNIILEPYDPNAVWIDGDYHLKSQAGRWNTLSQSWVIDDVTSPCIDAGDPNTSIGEEPFPNGGIINIGAYGRTPQASMSLLN